jgi:hypothetical protein
MMKPNFFKSALIAVCLLLTSIVSRATSPADAQIAMQLIESGKKLVVKAWNLPAERSASIRVYDADSELVYREVFKSGAYSRKYDMSQLKPGQYKLLLLSGTFSQSERFEVLGDGTVQVLENPTVNNFSPVVIMSGSQQVDVLIENRFSQKLLIDLRNEDGDLMYTAEVNPEGKFGRRLNLKHLPKDRYTLYISGGNYQFTREISLF